MPLDPSKPANLDSTIAIQRLTEPPPEQAEEEEETLRIGSATARQTGDFVMLTDAEGNDLFGYPRETFPFEEKPIAFLLNIFTIGWQKGKLVGSALARAKMRDFLGPE
jgi:hypothetical protein